MDRLIFKHGLIMAALAAALPAIGAQAAPIDPDYTPSKIYIITDTLDLSGSIPSLDSDSIPPVPIEVIRAYYENPPMKEVARTFVPDELLQYSMLPEEENVIELDIELPNDVSPEEVQSALAELQGQIADYARKFLGTRYVWGAKGPKAFDCSGFTGYVFKNFGYDIGANSRIQATRGQKVDLKDARVGDLMFFTRPKGGKTVGHVGMVIDVNPDDGTLKFIHASSKKGVTIQQFPDNGHYNRRFLQVRRVIDDSQLA